MPEKNWDPSSLIKSALLGIRNRSSHEEEVKEIELPSDDPSSNETQLLKILIENEVKRITPTLTPQGVIYKQIEPVMEFTSKEMIGMLNSLVDKQVIEAKRHNPMILCPICESPFVFSKLACVKCSSHHVKHVKIIEHLLCGYKGNLDKFHVEGLLLCPKCGMEIDEADNALGYPKKIRNIGSVFVCDDCGKKFDNPRVVFNCLNCKSEFGVSKALYVQIREYTIPDSVQRKYRMNNNIRILLVEDSPVDAELIKTVIHSFDDKNKFKIDHAFNGMDTYRNLREKNYDLILLDMNLPKTNGFVILSNIKNQGISTPVIMLTGNDDRELAVKCMKMGAADYLIKSMDTYEALPEKMDRILELN